MLRGCILINPSPWVSRMFFLELSSEFKEIICLQVDESEGDEAEAERKSCQDTLLEELHQDSLRKRWARQEAINATKKDIHYQDILFDGGYIFVDLCYYETLSFFASSFFILYLVLTHSS